MGVVTTVTLPHYWQNLPEGQFRIKKRPYTEISSLSLEVLYTKDLKWYTETTHTDDIDNY